jgi:undecaprenyl-diphosphatase
MSETLKAALLGAVQGVTEFLPISSSAHLQALRHISGFAVEGIAFDLSVHLATLLAVVIYFRRMLWRYLTVPAERGILWRLALATLPVVGAGLAFAAAREDPPLWAPMCGWTISGSYLLLSRHRAGTLGAASLSRSRLLGIGCAQACALFPGVSRSGSTITAGLWLGLSREEAARFSFLLSVPATLLAVGYEGLKLWRSSGGHDQLWAAAGVAMPVAFAVGLASIHVLLKMVRADSFHRFGWYNLAAALALAAYWLAV